MLNLHRLSNWSFQDLPIIVFAFLAWVSYLSTPDLPVSRNAASQLLQLLEKVPNDTSCRQNIENFHQEIIGRDARFSSLNIDVSSFVKNICHRLFYHGKQQHMFEVMSYSASYFPMHWTRNNLTLKSARLPALAYFIMVGPSDSVSALSMLVDHIHSHDHTILIHVDEKCEAAVHRSASAIAKSRTHIFVLKPERITWGGYSVVATQVSKGNLILILAEKRLSDNELP